MQRRIISGWISTVISLALVLLLVGMGVMLLVNARAVSDYFKENVRISVLMKETVDEDQAEACQVEIERIPGVLATRLITREEGMEEMAEMLGRDFLQVFQSSPIPVSIDVNLEAGYVSADSLEVVAAALEKFPLVDEVVYQTSLIDALNQNLGKISIAMGVLVLLLLFISFVLISNTVRLDLFSRRHTIHTMQLVGATRSFIRRPFVQRAALQGLFASLFAILLLLGGLMVVKAEFAQMFSIFTLDALLVVMGVMIGGGVAICALSTVIVVNRMVAFDRDMVYSI